jgi:hypothetical protein
MAEVKKVEATVTTVVGYTLELDVDEAKHILALTGKQQPSEVNGEIYNALLDAMHGRL